MLVTAQVDKTTNKKVTQRYNKRDRAYNNQLIRQNDPILVVTNKECTKTNKLIKLDLNSTTL